MEVWTRFKFVVLHNIFDSSPISICLVDVSESKFILKKKLDPKNDHKFGFILRL